MTGGRPAEHGEIPPGLAAILGPDLGAGAACLGRASLFDPPAVGEDPGDLAHRRAQARALCHHCPVLPRCADAAPAFAEMRGSHGFTVAGHTVRGRTSSGARPAEAGTPR